MIKLESSEIKPLLCNPLTAGLWGCTLKAPWTDTLEAAFCVLAGAWSWAETLDKGKGGKVEEEVRKKC